MCIDVESRPFSTSFFARSDIGPRSLSVAGLFFGTHLLMWS